MTYCLFHWMTKPYQDRVYSYRKEITLITILRKFVFILLNKTDVVALYKNSLNLVVLIRDHTIFLRNNKSDPN